MLRSLAHAAIDGQRVCLRFWRIEDAEIVSLEGWAPTGQHWRTGIQRFRNPTNGQIRAVRVITIFEYMGSRVYL